VRLSPISFLDSVDYKKALIRYISSRFAFRTKQQICVRKRRPRGITNFDWVQSGKNGVRPSRDSPYERFSNPRALRMTSGVGSTRGNGSLFAAEAKQSTTTIMVSRVRAKCTISESCCGYGMGWRTVIIIFSREKSAKISTGHNVPN
jgi:hypothetical protein